MPFKERYYTTEKIGDQARSFIDKLSKRHLDFLPKSSALLVLDMQKYFLEKESHAYIPSAEAIVPRIKMLQDAYLSKTLPVVQTRHLNTKEDANNMKRWWREIITKDNPLSKIIDELADDRVKVIEKTQYDAFFKTDLEEWLRRKRISQVVITGVMTHLCCETTARSAFMRGFEVFFVVDGTATYNKTFHLSSLTNLSHGFAIPVTVEELLEHFHGEEHA